MKALVIPDSTATQTQVWHWQTWEGLPYLQCSLLADWPHGFFTHQFWPRSPAELVAILHPDAQVYRVQQVHGNTVLTTTEVQVQTAMTAVGEKLKEPSLPQADGLLSESVGEAIWVCSADCTPALVADIQTGQVAAVHAGWRGTAARILQQAIARLQQQGSQLANLRVAMGPAIAGQVYQVSTEVAATVGASVAPLELQNQPELLLAYLQSLPNPPILPDAEPGRVRLDVRRINELQLQHLGLQPEQIAIAPHCTYQQADLFFSYRREGLRRVQWSGIVSQT